MERTNLLAAARLLLAISLTAIGLIVFVGTSAHAAATIIIINNDGAGEGFNDPTPRTPVGGNTGTTLGQQRLIVFQQAANILAALLTSTVTIQVRAQFNPQACDATTAVLGSAGPISTHRDFTNAPFSNTWYHQALANKLAGLDQSAGNPDINATFNLTLDAGTCLGGLVWYYGLDGNEGNNIELLPVVLHELGHGLGFSTQTSGTTGAFSGGAPSVFDRLLLDNTLDLHWNEMTAGQRVASAIGLNRLVWNGSATRAQAATYLGPSPQLTVSSPGGIATDPVILAGFGPQSFSLTANVVLVDDGAGADPNDACEALVNGAALAGNVALINRGTCTFVAKCVAAQAAGAVGVLIANNAASGAAPMGGSDPSITIPCFGITQADGNELKAALLSGSVSVTMGFNATRKSGADQYGRPLMYSPNPFQSGSSVSHWDVSLAPNALMEPAINDDLHNTIDLMMGQFTDIGWFPGGGVATAVDDVPAARAPEVLAVRAHPNPFTSTTALALSVPTAGRTSVQIYDLAGRLVRTLVDEVRPAGTLVRTWDGRDDSGVSTAAGVYIARLQVGDRAVLGKFVRVR